MTIKQQLITVLCLIPLILVGCGGGGGSSDSDSEPKGPCTDGATRQGPTSCGLKDVGHITQQCVDGVWEDTESCDLQCSGDWQNMRIHVADATNIADPEDQEAVMGFLDEAVERLETTLKVRATSPPLTLNRNVCHDIGIPASWRTDGLSNTDFVVFLGNTTEFCAEGTLAWATPCDWDAQGKPTAMRLNMCNTFITSSDPVIDVDTLEHEMIHGLGFSPASYGNFVDCDGNSLGGINETTRVVTNQFGESQTQITTGRTVMWAREYFGCPTMGGVALEDDGTEGTASAHWEQRLFTYETMSGAQFTKTKLSGLTLSLLEDTGWYQPDYSKVDDIFMGKGQGCDFVNAGSPFEFPFDYCTTEGAQGCAPDAIHKGWCFFDEFAQVPEIFQFFDDPNIGGPLIAEYFPFIAEPVFNPFTEQGFHFACTDSRGPQFQVTLADETWGSDSRCFEGINPQNNDNLGLCYQSVCNEDHLAIVYNDIEYECPQEGGSIGAPFNNVEIICPQFERICQ